MGAVGKQFYAMVRQPEQPFLHFSRRERQGIIAILTLIILVFLAPYLVLFMKDEDSALPADLPAETIAWADLQPDNNEKITSAPVNYRKRIDENEPAVTIKRFPFDPNNLDEKGWAQLGVSAKTAATIRKYLAKGGRFRSAEDLYKIWGMPAALADSLKHYVRIKQDIKEMKKDAKLPASKQQAFIDINRADSAIWESLPGIGPSLARRIVAFREKLGGFYQLEQVGETFGLPDSVFRLIRPRLLLRDDMPVRKIDLNAASETDLKNHPYIRYRLAKTIAAYRLQHGPFRSVSDIKLLQVVTDSLYRKLQPYLLVPE
ncbi:MAG TPA: helix-hairpin-helix domain-containing protein [Ferruginibacter sp.]|nr:helix-hairpin-helix domain-containing protein [Ferruginibacter sp.]